MKLSVIGEKIYTEERIIIVGVQQLRRALNESSKRDNVADIAPRLHIWCSVISIQHNKFP